MAECSGNAIDALIVFRRRQEPINVSFHQCPNVLLANLWAATANNLRVCAVVQFVQTYEYPQLMSSY